MRNNFLNEARVQRTIDPKIWASMSSMSSKNRATMAEDVKPMRKDLDNKDVLLQKYVAGLLTIKAKCPSNEQDIIKNKAYKNFGTALLNTGCTLSEIQKLYVENGGVYDGPIENTDIDSEEADYPDYNEVSIKEEPTSQSNYDDTAEPEFSGKKDEPIIEPKTQEYPKFEDVPVDDTESTIDSDVLKDEYSEDEHAYIDDDELSQYFKSVGYTLLKADIGDKLSWSDSEGLIITNDDENAFAVCVAPSRNYIDKKPRFMLLNNTSDVELSYAGNNGKYDAYYFKKDGYGIKVKAGSTYYMQEEINGKQYTNILAKLGNGAAIESKNLKDNINSRIVDYIKKYVYLPTLPELGKAENFLDQGRYWTSSIADRGNANIMVIINPGGDKIVRVDDTTETAKVVKFISF